VIAVIPEPAIMRVWIAACRLYVGEILRWLRKIEPLSVRQNDVLMIPISAKLTAENLLSEQGSELAPVAKVKWFSNPALQRPFAPFPQDKLLRLCDQFRGRRQRQRRRDFGNLHARIYWFCGESGMATIIYILASIAVFWVGMLSAVFMGGLLFLILAAIFAGLKVIGIIGWSWWWIALPVWGAIGGAIAKMWIVTRDPMWRFKFGRD
jgi:hypothetical protein